MDIYLSTWSLRSLLQNDALQLKDLPAIAHRYGFSGLEVMDRQLNATACRDADKLRKACSGRDLSLILDASTDLTHLDESLWQQQIAYVEKMLDLAHFLNARYLRILLGGQRVSFQKLFSRFLTGPDMIQNKSLPANKRLLQRLLASQFLMKLGHYIRHRHGGKIQDGTRKIEQATVALKRLLPGAESLKITLLIENHWGISSFPDIIINILKECDSEYLAACPDFDNFPATVDRYQALQLLAPWSGHVHAKSYEFDRSGQETTIDYRKCGEIFRNAGYGGGYTIEYEGSGDALSGAVKTQKLLMKRGLPQ
jgi:sugar phosphate isomerase/epimerase